MTEQLPDISDQRTTTTARCLINESHRIEAVQTIPTALLVSCYRRDLGIDIAGEFGQLTELTLHYCPSCHLHLFYPLVAVSAALYEQLSKRPWYFPDPKFEYDVAAEHISAGNKVLDIGCGDGRFATRVPAAEYQGLDLATIEVGSAEGAKVGCISRQSLHEHAAARPEFYDVCCAFQVLEHVTNPVAFIRQAMDSLKPGGKLIVGLPNTESYLGDLVNFTLNSPPHHLSWWSAAALEQLASMLDIVTVNILYAPVEHWEERLYWMARFARADSRYYRSSRRARVANLIAYAAGYVFERLGISVGDNMGSTMVWIAEKRGSNRD